MRRVTSAGTFLIRPPLRRPILAWAAQPLCRPWSPSHWLPARDPWPQASWRSHPAYLQCYLVWLQVDAADRRFRAVPRKIHVFSSPDFADSVRDQGNRQIFSKEIVPIFQERLFRSAFLLTLDGPHNL